MDDSETRDRRRDVSQSRSAKQPSQALEFLQNPTSGYRQAAECASRADPRVTKRGCRTRWNPVKIATAATVSSIHQCPSHRDGSRPSSFGSPPTWDSCGSSDRDLREKQRVRSVAVIARTQSVEGRHAPPQLVHPTSFPSAPTFGSSILVKNGGTLRAGRASVALLRAGSNDEGTYFCFASIKRYFRSSRVCSAVCMLTNVVAIPVLPERPVRPI